MRPSVTAFLGLFSSLTTQLYCQEQSSIKTVEQRIATFAPQVHSPPENRSCVGLVISPELLVMPVDCATKARQIMLSGSLTVDNLDSKEVGQLPDLSDDNSAQIRAAILPPMQLPFILEQELPETDDYPSIISGRNFTEGQYYVYNSDNANWLPVGVGRVDVHGSNFNLTAVSGELNETALDRLVLGSPVVNKLGDVLCLVGTGKQCQSLTDNRSEINDGSCHVQIFSCTNQTWSYCLEGMGTGSCIRPTDGRNCTVSVAPNKYDKFFSCHHAGGCGTVDCTYPSDTLNRTCIAEWGYCSLESEAESFPSGCVPEEDRDLKPRDPRCDKQAPTTDAPATNDSDDAAGVLTYLLCGVAVTLAISALVTGCKCSDKKTRTHKITPNERTRLVGVRIISAKGV